MRPLILSLYDYTAEAVRPWAAGGWDAICFDIQHAAEDLVECLPSGGSITYRRADLHDRRTLDALAVEFRGRANFLSSFPVCTDMAVSGARHFAAKEAAAPGMQRRAADYAIWCGDLGDRLGVPWFAENPVSVLSTLWRGSDHRFDPWEFGGYIPQAEAVHPRWPDYIPALDRYTKKTCLWTGGGFVMPERRPVHLAPDYDGSLIWKKLGGKSMKTKNIRSATPRGFAAGCWLANGAALVA